MTAPTTEQLSIIRSLIPDTDAVFGVAEDQYLFSDDDLTNFFTAGNDSVLRAAGYAVMAIGTSEAVISKIIRTQDLQTNGAMLSDSMVKKAQVLFDRADKDDAQAGLDYFEIIDYGEGWLALPPELTEYGY